VSLLTCYKASVPPKKQKLLALALVISAVLFAALPFESDPTIKLLGGDTLRFVGTSYGTNQFIYGHAIEMLLFKYLPYKGQIKFLSFRFNEPWKLKAMPSSFFGDSLNLWFSITGIDSSTAEFPDYWASHYRVVALDSSGQEYPNLYRPEQAQPILCLKLNAYPRSARTFTVRLLAKTKGNNWTSVAEIPIRNRYPVEKKQWTAQPLPITNHIAGTDVIFGGGEIIQAGQPNEWQVRLLLRCPQDGVDSGEIQLSRPSIIRDGHGNIWDVLRFPYATNGWTSYLTRFPLGADDVWKFEGELIRVKDFPEEDLVRFGNVPSTGEEIQITNHTGVVMAAKISTRSLEVRMPSTPKDLTMTIIAASDEQGTDLLTLSRFGRSAHDRSVALKKVPRQLRAVVAIQRLHPVEYYFKPTVVDHPTAAVLSNPQ
jgi:hypothetical protein